MFFFYWLMWHYVGGPPSRRSLCLSWRETKQRAKNRNLRRDRKWGEKGRSERSQGSGQGKAWEGSGQENAREGSWKKEPREGSWQRETQRGSRRRSAVREDQSRWVGIPRSFVQISRKIHVSGSLQMHRKCSVTEPPFLHFDPADHYDYHQPWQNCFIEIDKYGGCFQRRINPSRAILFLEFRDLLICLFWGVMAH